MANDDITDSLITYNLNLIKYQNSIIADVLVLLNELEKDVIASINTAGLSPSDKARLTQLLAEINATTKKYYTEIAMVSEAGIAKIPPVAVDAVTKSLIANTTAPFTAIASPQTLGLLVGDTLIQGYPQRDWWAKQSQDTVIKFNSVVRNGIASGISTQEMARDIERVLDISRHNAEALVRTSAMTVSNDAIMATYEANEAVIKNVEWMATLDSRTCAYCNSMDGETFLLDDIKPAIPSHWNCRCVFSPNTKSWEELGIL